MLILNVCIHKDTYIFIIGNISVLLAEYVDIKLHKNSAFTLN